MAKKTTSGGSVGGGGGGRVGWLVESPFNDIQLGEFGILQVLETFLQCTRRVTLYTCSSLILKLVPIDDTQMDATWQKDRERQKDR